MGILDFSQLDKSTPGETFEALIRTIGQRLDMVVHSTGRGPDDGRDLVFVEMQKGPMHSTQIRWLVNCKDYSTSKKSVSESDIGSILDKTKQHKCDGFLLATSTVVSAGMAAVLEALNKANGGDIHTLVWDRFKIEEMLLKDDMQSVRSQFFPSSPSQVIQSEVLLSVVDKSLPRFLAGEVRQHLVALDHRVAEIDGQKVWPFDLDQIEIISKIQKLLRSYQGPIDAASLLCNMHFDAFTACINALIRNFPVFAKRTLIEVVEKNLNDDITYNAIEILRENRDFTFEQEVEITKNYESWLLYDLYHEFVENDFNSKSFWRDKIYQELSQIHLHFEIEDLKISDLEFSGGEGINYSANVELLLSAYEEDHEQPHSLHVAYVCFFEGYITAERFEIDTFSLKRIY